MSELKEHQFCKSDEFFREYHGPLSNEMRPYYLKCEVDEVLAEKDKKIAELQAKVTLASLAEDCSNLRNKRCNYCSALLQKMQEIRRLKYKRCVDMVAYCDLKMSYWAIREIHEGDTGKFDLYSKWHKRWLQLAEKFKEAK